MYIYSRQSHYALYYSAVLGQTLSNVFALVIVYISLLSDIYSTFHSLTSSSRVFSVIQACHHFPEIRRFKVPNLCLHLYNLLVFIIVPHRIITVLIDHDVGPFFQKMIVIHPGIISLGRRIITIAQRVVVAIGVDVLCASRV